MTSNVEDASSSVDKGMTAQEVADAIRARVAADGLQPGDRVGAERELSALYDVSRWVVRKALEALEEDGRILRTSGRNGGIFVAHEKVLRDLRHHVSLPEYVQARGLEAGSTVLSTATLPASSHVATAMEVREGSWLLRVDRLRLAGGLPLSYEVIWLPAEQFPGLLDRSLVGSLYELLENAYELERGEAVETISARAADKAEASMLQMPNGSPVLSVSRVSRTAAGRVFEYGEDLYRADRTEMIVRVPAGENAVQRHVGEPRPS